MLELICHRSECKFHLMALYKLIELSAFVLPRDLCPRQGSLLMVPLEFNTSGAVASFACIKSTCYKVFLFEQ